MRLRMNEDLALLVVVVIVCVVMSLGAVEMLGLNVVKTVDHTEVRINETITSLERTIELRDDEISRLREMQPPDYGWVIAVIIIFSTIFALLIAYAYFETRVKEAEAKGERLKTEIAFRREELALNKEIYLAKKRRSK